MKPFSMCTTWHSKVCVFCIFFYGSCLFAVSWMPVSLNGKASWGSTGRRSLMSWSFGSAQAPLAMAMSTWVWTVVWWSHLSLTESTSLSHRSDTTAVAAWTGFLFVASLSLCVHSTTPLLTISSPFSLLLSVSQSLCVCLRSLSAPLPLSLSRSLSRSLSHSLSRSHCGSATCSLCVSPCVSAALSLSQSRYVLSRSLFCLSAFLFFPFSVFLC